jgi:hypothetical protein
MIPKWAYFLMAKERARTYKEEESAFRNHHEHDITNDRSTVMGYKNLEELKAEQRKLDTETGKKYEK